MATAALEGRVSLLQDVLVGLACQCKRAEDWACALQSGNALMAVRHSPGLEPKH